MLFPHLLMPLSVGRPASLAAVEAALATEEQEIVIAAQRDASLESPGLDDLYRVGTKAVIKRMTRPTEDAMELIVLGSSASTSSGWRRPSPSRESSCRPLPLPDDTGPEVEALHHEVMELGRQGHRARAAPGAVRSWAGCWSATEDPLRLAYLLASMFGLEVGKEQALLEAQTRADALRLTHSYLAHELQVLELRSKIASTAQNEMGKEQREYFLRQQLRAIQQELGEKNPEQAEVGTAPRAAGESRTCPKTSARRPSANCPPGAAARRRAGLPRHPHLPRSGAGAALEGGAPRISSTSPGRARSSTRTTTT